MELQKFGIKLFLDANLVGIDLSKKTTKRARGEKIDGIRIPEATGVLSGSVCVILLILFLPFTIFYEKNEKILLEYFSLII